MARRTRWQLDPNATPEQLAELARTNPRGLSAALRGSDRAARDANYASSDRQADVARIKDAAGRRA
jgi:hypothetical protein